MTNKKIVLFFLLPVLISFILHFHVFNLDVLGFHVWRQSQTQTVIYHFSYSDPSILNPQQFDLGSGSNKILYEFPLYQWMISQVNHVFGYSVMNSRLFTFGIFILLLFGFYRLLRHFVEIEIALIVNTLLCFSPLLHYYSVNPMPDIFALCAGTWALSFFFDFIRSEKRIHFIAFAFCLMLAALTKLPFVLFGSVYLLYFIRQLRQKRFAKLIPQVLLILLCLIPALFWYAKAIPTWKNNELASGIFKSNKSILELLNFFQFHLFSTVPELITNYASCAFLVFGIYLFIKAYKELVVAQSYLVFLFCFLSLYFFYELNLIEMVHDYYLMPFVPLIFLVVAYGVNAMYKRGYKKFITLVLFVVPITAWIRIDGRWNTVDPGFTDDYLYKNDSIQKLIPKGALCLIDYDDSKFIALYYLKRQGFSMQKNELNPEKLNDYYNKGARYLVTENLNFDPAVYPQFNFEERFRNNLKIYKMTR